MNNVKQAPQAPELETAILGAIIRDGGEVLDRINDILKSDMFFDPKHAELFSLLLKMHRVNTTINLTTVFQSIRDSGKNEEFTPPYLTGLINNPAGFSELEHYARVIAEKSTMRHIIKRLDELSNAAYTSPIDEISEDLARLEDEINETFTGGDTGTDMKQLTREVLKVQDDKISKHRRGDVTGVRTGFSKLDRKIGGFQPGTFTLIAGRPGSGKTTIGLNFAEFAAKMNIPVLFFSYEMTHVQIGEFLLSKSSGIDRISLRDGLTTNNELDHLHKGAGIIERLNIKLFDNPMLTVDNISATVKRHVKREGLTLVIIDYLQLIPAEDKRVNREQQVSAISRGLKKLSLSLNIPIICLAQLNREASNGEAQLNQLRESGALEQDADTVILIYPEIATDADNILMLKIAKNRHGEPGKISLFHDGQFTKFSENEIIDTIQTNSSDTYTPPF